MDYEQFLRNIGANIKRIRESQELSRTDITRKLECSHHYYKGIENGEKNPTLGYLNKIGEVLNVDIDELCKSDGQKK